jgi:hypothetical protein
MRRWPAAAAAQRARARLAALAEPHWPPVVARRALRAWGAIATAAATASREEARLAIAVAAMERRLPLRRSLRAWVQEARAGYHLRPQLYWRDVARSATVRVWESRAVEWGHTREHEWVAAAAARRLPLRRSLRTWVREAWAGYYLRPQLHWRAVARSAAVRAWERRAVEWTHTRECARIAAWVYKGHALAACYARWRANPGGDRPPVDWRELRREIRQLAGGPELSD